jgi:hypothetical protein
MFKVTVIYLNYKINSIHFNYFLSDLLSVVNDCVRDLEVTVYSKLHFRRNVSYLYSQVLKLLRLTHFIL